MSEIERRKHQGKEVATRHIPQEIVPVPIAEARDLVHDAVHGTSLRNPVAQVLSGWAFFQPRLRFTSVDDTHTRIEIDVAGPGGAAGAFLYPQRRAAIHRFFVAIQDELDRRERWRPRTPAEIAAAEATEPKAIEGSD